MYFCVKCGKKIESGVFCSEHDDKSEALDMDLNLKICPSGKYYFYQKWKKYGSPEAFLKAVYNKKFRKKVEPKYLKETSKKVYYEIDGQTIELKIEKSDAIAMMHSQYFEGVIQFRYPKSLESRIKEVLNLQKEYWMTKEVFVTKESKQTEGMDWWVTSKKAMSMFADKLNRRFGAKISKNAQLFSRNKQTSKNIYRLNVLVQFPDFEEGAVIKVNNKLAKILQLRRLIKAVDIKTGKTFGFKLSDDHEVLQTKKTRVSNVHPEITVLDPESFQEISIDNPKIVKELNTNEKVKVLVYENKTYLIP